MWPRIVVIKTAGSEKYTMVRAATDMVAEIDRVLDARNRAIRDEAHERFGASSHDVRALLVQNRRATLAQGRQDRLWYLVIDFATQKRSRYYASRGWADIVDGRYYLHKWNARQRQWIPIPRESKKGRFVIPRDA